MFTIILAGILAPFSIIGLVQLYRAQKIKVKQQAFGAAFNRLIKEHKLSIELTETFNKRALGLDRKNRKLIWVDHSTGDKQEVCISLLGVATCCIDQKKDLFNNMIKMIIHYRRCSTPSVLSFFDAGHDKIKESTNALKKARTWKNKIDLYKYPGNIHLEQEFIL